VLAFQRPSEAHSAAQSLHPLAVLCCVNGGGGAAAAAVESVRRRRRWHSAALTLSPSPLLRTGAQNSTNNVASTDTPGSPHRESAAYKAHAPTAVTRRASLETPSLSVATNNAYTTRCYVHRYIVCPMRRPKTRSSLIFPLSPGLTSLTAMAPSCAMSALHLTCTPSLISQDCPPHHSCIPCPARER
jgi:hypothetical protein